MWFTVERGLNLLFGATTVAALVIAVQERKRKRLTYAILSNTLVRDQKTRVPNLEVRWANEPIDNFTITRLALWNWGRETIRREDIAESNPIRLNAADGVHILDTSVIQATSPPSKCTSQPEPTSILLSFEFLDYKQGSIIEVLHTGATPKALTLSGTIRGGETIREVNIAEQAKSYLASKRRKRGRISRFVESTFELLLAPLFLGSIFFSVSHSTPAQKARGDDFLWVLLFTAIAWWVFLFFRRLYRRLRSLPEGFERIAEGLFDI